MTYDPRAYGARCDICPLAKTGKPVPPTAKTPVLAIVGEGPGRAEEKLGAPFVGASGKFLDDRLRKDARIDRDSCHITNAALCRGEKDKDNERAAECCAPRLLAEVEKLPANVPVVALGKTATRVLLGVRNILSSRGFIWRAREIEPATIRATKKKDSLKGETLALRAFLAGRVILPTLHPAFVLRADTWKPISELDWRRIGRVVRGKVKKLEDECDYQIGGPELLRDFGPAVAADIETDGIRPLECGILSIGISDGRRTVELWPWHDWFARDVAAFFASRSHVIFHNGNNFDLLCLEQHGVVW